MVETKWDCMKNLSLHLCLFIFGLTFQACDDDPAGRLDLPTAGNIETVAGMGPTHFDYSGDGGPATKAKIGWITAIATDRLNNIYITDGASNTVRRITVSDGAINTVTGTFIGFNVVDPTPYEGDGGPANAAHLNIPLSVTVDGSENIFIIDAGNNVIRRISGDDGTIGTFAGTTEQGYGGDGGPAIEATFFNPYSITTDNEGNLYLADAGNHVVRMISKATGMIVTIAGTGPDNPGYSGDGDDALLAKLNYPKGIAIDAAGDIYISDGGNNVVRKISNGIISTIAGNGEAGYSGDGGLATDATLFGLSGLALDSDGNLYIADTGNNVIRKVDASTGKISTYAGNGSAGYSGDGGPATSATLSGPWGVAVDSDGNVFIADTGNSAIRVVGR